MFSPQIHFQVVNLCFGQYLLRAVVYSVEFYADYCNVRNSLSYSCGLVCEKFMVSSQNGFEVGFFLLNQRKLFQQLVSKDVRVRMLLILSHRILTVHIANAGLGQILPQLSASSSPYVSWSISSDQSLQNCFYSSVCCAA